VKTVKKSDYEWSVWKYYSYMKRATDLKSLEEIFRRIEDELIAKRKRLKDELAEVQDELKALNEAYSRVKAEMRGR
jgi:predicted nuclease with TOPRIM domain